MVTWIEKYKSIHKNSHRDVKPSAGSTVDNAVITTCGAKGHWTYWGDHFTSYINV